MQSVLATLTAIPTPTNTPTPTLVPTATNIPPTATPSITPSPTRGFSAVEAEYTLTVGRLINGYSTALEELGKLVKLAGDNTLLMVNKPWQFQVATQIVAIQSYGKQLRGLKPPARFTAYHSDLVESTTHFDNAMDLLMDGIDYLDAGKISQALVEMNLGGIFIDRANKKLTTLISQ